VSFEDLDRLVRESPRDELPALLGRLVELEARVRLRLAEISAAPSAAAAATRTIDGDEAAAIAATSKRWLLSKTKGVRFRCDLSRKQPRFDEAGLRRWLAERR
jgi:hypothetical protein